MGEKTDNKIKKNILIGGAWPYANSSLHLGHLAALLPGDVLARYHRQIGNNVVYVSGTDCHGTPITIRAKKEGITPKEIAERYHKEFSEVFEKMMFSYDLYTKTENEYHQEKVKVLFKQMYDNGYIYGKDDMQPFCENCNKFLEDRELLLVCPSCGNITKGDMCDCGYEPREEDFKDATCQECGNKVSFKANKNLYLALSKLQPQIHEYVNENKSHWRLASQNESIKYLKEGLPDKAVTRNLDWGIDIPIPGYEDKRMYVWIEAVLGYLTTAQQVCLKYGWDWEDFWKKDHKNNVIYMVHGKDNITFHTIILPGLLLALNDNYKLPDQMVASQYLNINQEKISKSKGNGITILDMIKNYDVDMIRYYFIANGPEKKDSNFSIDEFIASSNSNVVNKYGNLINRTLKYKGLEEVPNGKMDPKIKELIEKAYEDVSEMMESLELRKAMDTIIKLVEDGNKYYEEKQPWKQEKENIEEFNNTIFTCSNLIANLANLLNPIMPNSSQKVRKLLNVEEANWEYIEIEQGLKLKGIEPLFEKIK